MKDKSKVRYRDKENGLVGDTLYTVQSGFVIVPVVKLTESGLELFKKVA